MPTATPVNVPRENVNDETATLVAWHADDGERVERGRTIAQVETSKAVIDVEAPAGGVVRHCVAAGSEVPIGATIARIESDDPRPPDPTTTAGPTATPTAARPTAPLNGSGPATAPTAGPRFSRRARSLLIERGLDPGLFTGLGLVRSRDLPGGGPPRSGAGAEPRPPTAAGVPYRAEPLSRSKRTEAKFLRAAYESALASSVAVSCDAGGLLTDARHEGTALVLFEAARLLRKYPALNARHDDGRVLYYEQVNIGFAVDAGRGLKAPVVRRADEKGFDEIVAEVREYVVAYLQDALTVESLGGGTFTLTDLSGEGVFVFHPLINQGQSAILGVGGDAPRGALNLILTFDHQLAEGRYAARFLNDLKVRLEAHGRSLAQPTHAGPGDGPRCGRCQTPAAEVEAIGHYLVSSVRPSGAVRLLCTNCLRGY